MDLGSPDIRTELVGLKKFESESDPIDGGLGQFGWNLVGLGVGLGEIMYFNIIFYRVERAGWRIEWSDTRTECGKISQNTSVIHP